MIAVQAVKVKIVGDRSEIQYYHNKSSVELYRPFHTQEDVMAMLGRMGLTVIAEESHVDTYYHPQTERVFRIRELGDFEDEELGRYCMVTLICGELKERKDDS